MHVLRMQRKNAEQLQKMEWKTKQLRTKRAQKIEKSMKAPSVIVIVEFDDE